MRPPDELLSYLRNNDHYYLVTHIYPDGDAIGSVLALGEALTEIGKETVLFNKDKVPEYFRFLPYHKLLNHSIPKHGTDKYTLVLIDCNEPDRAAIEEVPFKHSIVIDHHETVSEFGDIKWVAPDAPATGMMIFYLIKSLGVPVTTEMATNLYTAITVDTGTFRHSNTNAETLIVASELIRAGVNPSFIADKLYDSWSKARFNLLIKSLNSLEIYEDVAILIVTERMIQETGATIADTENFVNFPKMMQSINVSVLFREIGVDLWKASLRSRGSVSVSVIAERFGGGGHRNAAGFRVKADIETAKRQLLNNIRNSKKQAPNNN